MAKDNVLVTPAFSLSAKILLLSSQFGRDTVRHGLDNQISISRTAQI